jgi:purine-nucleoside/S-methyl-5'-thioadenosine phosphorylase / adenosine deaminase
MNWIKSQGLSEIKGVVHGFSNKGFKGSLSEAARLFGLSCIATLDQIHSSKVFVIKDRFKELEQKGDALIADLKGIGVGVFTADCVPILLVDKSASVAAAVHAGWRGTLSQITKATLIEMEKSFGITPSRICAVLGPSIGACCYEVGEDVASLFMNKSSDWERYLSRKGNSKYALDLKEANIHTMAREGVEDIEVMEMCTKCSSEFHSYRRDGKKVGSQLNFIGLI